MIDDALSSECVLELQSTHESLMFGDLMLDSGAKQVDTLLTTIAGETGFCKLLYYPIVCDSGITAVVEIGYKNPDKTPASPLTQ